MALLRPRLGGGGGGSCDPPAGLEDRFRYRSHGVRAGSARRGAGECSQARRHSAMSDALHQRLPSRRRRGTDCLATKRLETPRTRPSCGATKLNFESPHASNAACNVFLLIGDGRKILERWNTHFAQSSSGPAGPSSAPRCDRHVPGAVVRSSAEHPGEPAAPAILCETVQYLEQSAAANR